MSKKSIIIHFLMYSLFQSLPNHLHPNFLTHKSLDAQSLANQPLFPTNHSLPNRLLAPTHPVPSLLLSNLLPGFLIALPLIFEKNIDSPIDQPLINPQLTWSSDVDCIFICITNPRSIDPTDLVPSLLLLSLVFCYQIFL